MKRAHCHFILPSILFFSGYVAAQTGGGGTIRGEIVEESTNRSIEFVNVRLQRKADSVIVAGKSTDNTGKFDFTDVSPGEYAVRFSQIGYQEKSTPFFLIDASHKHMNLGTVVLVPTAVNLDEVLVTGEKSMYSNSIDRKVYNVGQDLMSKSGSASDLLQNVPSVQVDIDGNVSLRGSSNVLFMVNGRSSPLMNRNSAEALQQIPASSIEKIEVITNPSAKYKPDGASGIINIVLKKNTAPGINGNITANAGNQDRYNGALRLNYNPGSWNMTANYGIRRDNRNRYTTDRRIQSDSSSQQTYYTENLSSVARPLSHQVSLGIDWKVTEGNQAGVSGNMFLNGFIRSDLSDKLLANSDGTPASIYERSRYDDEYQREYELTGYIEHAFPKEDQKLRLEFTASKSPEQEDNHYTNTYQFPAAANQYDNTLIKATEKKSQFTAEYSDPLSDASSLEAGYSGEVTNNDLDHFGEYFDPNQSQFITDYTKTNRFLHDEAIHAVYATYKQSFGAFGVLGGVRSEYVSVTTDLVTNNLTLASSYFSVYPTLHLSYKIDTGTELQLSYSRRARRPEAEDLNPFPEYRDPRNVSAGNPTLLPEYTHSVELGCQIQNDRLSILPALFYRHTYNRMTSITQLLNDTTLLTTKQNLSYDQSGGLELIVSGNIGNLLTVNWNASAFVNQIDASNLGYSDRKSVTTWTSTMSVSMNVASTSRLQINSNYNSSRLTPQGEFSPSYGINTGVRQELWDGKVSLVLTISDIFKTAKRELTLATPVLNQTTINTRDARIVFLGFTYRFGILPKNTKDDQLHYDDNF